VHVCIYIHICVVVDFKLLTNASITAVYLIIVHRYTTKS
jgi:hypothetical protein